jgi:hypothetical protein
MLCNINKKAQEILLSIIVLIITLKDCTMNLTALKKKGQLISQTVHTPTSTPSRSNSRSSTIPGNWEFNSALVKKIEKGEVGTFHCLKQSRTTKEGTVYTTAKALTERFGQDCLIFERFGRMLCGIVLMQDICLPDSAHLLTMIKELMHECNVIDRDQCVAFYTFAYESGLKSRKPTTSLTSLFQAWKQNVRSVLEKLHMEFQSPSFTLMGNYCHVPMSLNSTAMVSRRFGGLFRDHRECFVKAAGLVWTEANGFASKKTTEGYGIPGYFTYFFKFIQSKFKAVPTMGNSTWSAERWQEEFETLSKSQVPMDLFMQPMIVCFVLLEILNSVFKSPVGGTFFKWYNISSVREFRSYFTHNLHKFIVVYSLIVTYEDNDIEQYTDLAKYVTNHPLNDILNEKIVQDRSVSLATDQQYTILKVSKIAIFKLFLRFF